MKYLLASIIATCFFYLSTLGQLNAIKSEIENYLIYRTGKVKGLKVNQENTDRFSKNTNKALRSFALSKNKNKTDSSRIAWNNNKIRFFSLQGIAEVSIHSFDVAGHELEIYAYTSQDLENYIIKDRKNNNILFEGDGVSYLVDSIYKIDEGHFLIIEKFGDLNTSRRLQVLKSGKTWTPLDAFFGITEAGSKPLLRRYFKLYCEFGHTLSGPRDINKITYLPGEKALSLKVYSDERKFRQVRSVWMNRVFNINDVDVSETLDVYHIDVPAE